MNGAAFPDGHAITYKQPDALSPLSFDGRFSILVLPAE